MRYCALDGCGRPHYSNGWCKKHHYRWQRYGDPTRLAQLHGDPEGRFWAKVEKDGPLPAWAPFLGPCWLWTASTADGGYAKFYFEGRLVPGHRFAYELLVSPIQEGLVLDHLCRVHNCVNPSHLEPVTTAENLARGVSPPALNSAKSECPAGHPLSGDNLQVWRGRRKCRTCANARRRVLRGAGG